MSQFSITQLSLTDFRCYDWLRLDIENKPVVLIGPNGAGKTNILEAFSMLMPGRGLRQVKLSELSRIGGRGGWAVASSLVTPKGLASVGTGYSLSRVGPSRERRIIKINGLVLSSQNSLTEYISAIWLTPQMDRLFSETISGRRQFFDQLVCSWDPSHIKRISEYTRAMRQRLFLLKDQGSQDLSWISALEETMVSRGAAIAAARVDLLNRLLPIVRDGIELFPGASLMLDGDLELWLKNSPALGVEEQFRKILVTNRYKDGSSGRTQCGVHLTDMVVYHKEKNQEASFCSTGEQKALLISIILAHAKARSISIGAVPLLLFDEIAAHLDEERREALFSHLENLGGQTWFTGTEENIFQKISKRAQLLRVANGKISYV